MSLRKNIHPNQQHFVELLFFHINKVEAMKQENKNLWDVNLSPFTNIIGVVYKKKTVWKCVYNRES